jgi:hypothetical protein
MMTAGRGGFLFLNTLYLQDVRGYSALRARGGDHPDGAGLGLDQVGVAVTGSIVGGSSAGFVRSSHAAWVVIGGCGLALLALA